MGVYLPLWQDGYRVGGVSGGSDKDHGKWTPLSKPRTVVWRQTWLCQHLACQLNFLRHLSEAMRREFEGEFSSALFWIRGKTIGL